MILYAGFGLLSAQLFMGKLYSIPSNLVATFFAVVKLPHLKCLRLAKTCFKPRNAKKPPFYITFVGVISPVSHSFKFFGYKYGGLGG
jgi:hypothetical protein